MADDRTDDGLGRGFWLKFMGVLALGAVGMMLAFVLFSNAWAKWGFFGAMIVFTGVLLLIAWIGDRRSQRRYEDLPEG